MFILRRITSEGSQSNIDLGSDYSFIDERFNKTDFERTICLKDYDNESVYGFVIHDNGSEIMPLHKKSKYYIMTGKGDTFANISFR